MLEIKNLTVSFGENEALKEVSFMVKENETIGVVGESGSGKSLCSLAIMNLLPSAAKVVGGSIFFQGVNSMTTYKGIRGRKIGMIFQEPMTSLNPVFTCGAQILETILSNENVTEKEAKKRTYELLEMVKLPNPKKIFHQYPHELSGGQKQRIMIAAAISCNPALLIADEPTTALDVTVQKEILSLLKDLQTRIGMSVLFITHDLPLVANIATRVLVMKDGKIVERGSVSKVFNEPSHPYTKALLSCKPLLNKRYKKLPTINDFGIDNKFYLEEESPVKRKQRQENIYKNKPILITKDLRVSFPIKKNWLGKVTKEHVAVNNINFQLYQGESLGLIGESGCGKTTIGRTIVNLIKPAQGRVLYQNQNIADFTKEAMFSFRKDVQIIFQDPFASLNPRKRVGEAIQEPIEVYEKERSSNEKKEQVFDLLAKVGLETNDYFKYPHEFSGGQRQRISIARTLAMKPKIIICDESVSALDVSVQAQILNLLNELKEAYHLTFLFISHDLSVVKHFCDRMIVMSKKGVIEEEGETDDLYSNPKSHYTKTLINSIPK